MKLISTHLKNFGKYKDRTFNFESGTTMIRGRNEGGKTTLLLAALYCWFGTQVLDYPVEHYINNEGATSLKVVNEFEVDGALYTCSRGTSGAELRRNDEVLATNHGPVTAKVEEILGIPPGKASGTMFAKQNQVQGIIALGPTALAAYIEKLAGFDQVDDLVTRLSEKLETGSTKPFEEQLISKREQLRALPELVEEIAVDDKEVDKLTSALATAEAMLSSTRAEASTIEARRKALTDQIKEAQRVEETRQRLAVESAGLAVLPQQIAVAEEHIALAGEFLAYQEFHNLPARPADEWEGDCDSLAAEIARHRSGITEYGLEDSSLASTIREKEKQKLVSTVCPFTKEVCKELSDVAVIERTNSQIKGEVDALQAQKLLLAVKVKNLKDDLVVLENLLTFHDQMAFTLLSYGDRIAIDKSVIPWKATWAAAVPEDVGMATVDPTALRQKLASASRAQAQLDVLPAAVEVGGLKAQLQGLFDTDVSALETAVTRARQELATARQKFDQERARFELAKNSNLRTQTTRASLTRDIEELGIRIAKMKKDAALMKAVRAARLVVAELIWSKVLAGTSNYFSRMRGTPSEITRSPKGFLVNNHPIVSGSTFDCLGLSLLMTLTKLFSCCSILMLDEVGAGADEKRAAMMLGTLAGSGFSQVFFITHRQSDESACENLLEVA